MGRYLTEEEYYELSRKYLKGKIDKILMGRKLKELQLDCHQNILNTYLSEMDWIEINNTSDDGDSVEETFETD